ncbi:MAG: 4-hydroxy-tetrahydrodipicolinate reductase [Clostridiales Family XIII bacterium]|jgi:4-hydroxy-tetrahydrodipicolinate reductase|nr:4-hydroxy-tetrahydrodipicolinate reductase [Clostridiales Family XIII bacterium]
MNKEKTMIKVIINGAGGKMGTALRAAIEAEPDMQVIAGFDKDPDTAPPPFAFYASPADCAHGADVVIDFSHYSAVPDLLAYCLRTNTPAVIATTALGDAEDALVRAASARIPVFRTANMSLGVNVVSHMAQLAAPALESDFNIEIVEAHHNKKTDAPSGTALLLADAINGALATKKDLVFGRHGKNEACRITDLGIHAIRGGSVPGEHTVLFLGPDEVIEIKHTVFSRNVFALGAVKAARFLTGKAPGLYSMDDLIAAGAPR